MSNLSAPPGVRLLAPDAPPVNSTVAAACLRRHEVALARLDELRLKGMPLARYMLRRVGTAGAVGMSALISAVALAVLGLLPAQQSLNALRAELARPHSATSTASTDSSLERFVVSLPTRTQVPAVLGVMLTQAAAANVALDEGHYSYRPAQTGKLAQYAIEFPIKGSYTNIRGFVDATLQALPAVGLDQLSVSRKNIGDSAVTAQVRFILYLRDE